MPYLGATAPYNYDIAKCLVQVIQKLGKNKKHLGHHDNLLAWELELFDRIAQDDLGETVRIYLSK